MTRAHLHALATLAALGLAAAPAAHAQTYRVDATGIITQVHNGPNVTLDTQAVGQTITFHFLFDRSAPGFDQSNGVGTIIAYALNYTQGAPDYGVSGSFGSYTLANGHSYASGGGEDVYNNVGSTTAPQDRLDLVSYGLSVNGSGFGGEAVLTLDDPTGQALSGSQLPPTSAYNLINFPASDFYFTPDSSDDARSTISGRVTSLSATDISSAPEPSQWAALSLGAFGLGGLALRTRRRVAQG